MSSDIDKKEPGVIFRMTTKALAWYVLPLPTVAFLSCVVLSVLFNFERATATHCRVDNYLPSISAAIGGFTPQRYIWRICIALHSSPRLMVAIFYYNHYIGYRVSQRRGLYNLLVIIVSATHILEIMSLVTLSYISSTENYFIHENSFIAFMIFATIHMILMCVVFKWSKSPFTPRQRTSFKWKIGLLSFNMSSFLAAIYFFLRHNKHCEPGVYTFFALCEYFTVLSNIAFHATTAIDVERGELVFSEVPVHKLKKP